MTWDKDEIEKWLHLVRAVAIKFYRKTPACVEYDDLHQWGVFGLADATRLYKQESGVPFHLYANRRIRGAMIDGLRSMDWVPRNIRATGEETRHIGSLDYFEERRRKENANPDHGSEWLGRYHPEFSEVDDRDEVEWLLKSLHRNELKVVQSYYLGETLMCDVGEQIGVNESRISQIRSSAIRTLREMAAA
jgi:RNA polymerase sigma factor (sigma-70 family)